MVRIREKNINTEAKWDELHTRNKAHNDDIVNQFERFFSLNFLPTNEQISVLDVGCGQALHFPELHKRYPLVEWNGLEISDAVIQKNLKRWPNAKYQKKDIMLDEIDGVFDYIVSMHTFEHLEDPNLALQKCIKHCKKDVIICVPYQDAWGTDETHIHKFTKEDPFTNYRSCLIVNKDQEIYFVFSGEAT